MLSDDTVNVTFAVTPRPACQCPPRGYFSRPPPNPLRDLGERRPENAPRSKPLSVSLALVHTIKCLASSVRTEPVTRPPLSHEDNVVSILCVSAGAFIVPNFPMAAATGEILCGEFAAQE